jgi:chemotaxis protein methyltransferase CheR
VKPQDFEFLQKTLKDRSGIVLSADKAYLVESRLTPVARKRGIASLDDLVAALRKGDAGLLTEVIDAMTTNESLFFRDLKPFEGLRDLILPSLAASRKATGRSKIRIWCAACSSGQEPYSISLVIRENAAKFQGVQFEIVATDLSTEMVARATEGIYTQFEVQRGLPIQMLIKYFKQQGDRWHLDDAVRRMVQFKRFNLLENYRPLGVFDVIFCRNVLIYFDDATKRAVLARLAARLAADGYLVLGAAETTTGISTEFMQVAERHHGVFCFTPQAAAAARRRRAGQGGSAWDARPDTLPACASGS